MLKEVVVRKIAYKTSWSYNGSAKRQGTLVDLVLDILYLMEETGVIPPMPILNHVLQSGGGSGGMGPGTSWKPFHIDEKEYKELILALQHLDVEDARKLHPYIRFKQITIDPEFENCTDYIDWLTKSHDKYAKNAI